MTRAIACATPSADPAPRIRRVYTSQEKAEHLALFEQSGMTQGDFCREMGISGSTFSLWRRRPREEAGSAESTPQFAEVQLSAPTTGATTAATVTVHLPGGAKIEVNAATDVVWQGLGLLLKTLQS